MKKYTVVLLLVIISQLSAQNKANWQLESEENDAVVYKTSKAFIHFERANFLQLFGSVFGAFDKLEMMKGEKLESVRAAYSFVQESPIPIEIIDSEIYDKNDTLRIIKKMIQADLGAYMFFNKKVKVFDLKGNKHKIIQRQTIDTDSRDKKYAYYLFQDRYPFYTNETTFAPIEFNYGDIVEEETIVEEEEITLEEEETIKENPVKETNFDKIFTTVEKYPKFKKGQTEFYKKLRYKSTTIKGKVFVQFVIDKNGNVINPKVIKSLSPECDKQALEIIKSMAKWIPGEHLGQKVAVQLMYPITFE
ncbi:energy transducer TonB [Aquimarina sp. 2201CG5-10]|uniref:energy transducer TonB n=1 Tax=Aquimarina callyspongiae TaxID=3098150 RepID=UPI002AB431AA|nr:energy transducer TonB [Aquimarina sp. 2201CG5-10]MDY8134274.1 energy transducer TonB [Aquimarina sp. 2201CG5-10]